MWKFLLFISAVIVWPGSAQDKQVYLTTHDNWAFFKVLATGQMTQGNVKDTCEATGMEYPCWRSGTKCLNAFTTWSDDCIAFDLPDGSDCRTPTLGALSIKLCGNDRYWQCPPLFGTFVYFYSGLIYTRETGARGVEFGSDTLHGDDYYNKYALCATRDTNNNGRGYSSASCATGMYYTLQHSIVRALHSFNEPGVRLFKQGNDGSQTQECTFRARNSDKQTVAGIRTRTILIKKRDREPFDQDTARVTMPAVCRLLQTALIAMFLSPTLVRKGHGQTDIQNGGTVNVTAGSDADLQWTYTLPPGITPLFQTWKKLPDTGIASKTGNVYISQAYQGRVELFGESGLRLKNVTTSDSGTYQLYMVSSDGASQTLELTLQVVAVPETTPQSTLDTTAESTTLAAANQSSTQATNSTGGQSTITLPTLLPGNTTVLAPITTATQIQGVQTLAPATSTTVTTTMFETTTTPKPQPGQPKLVLNPHIVPPHKPQQLHRLQPRLPHRVQQQPK
ncbi:Hypp7538 [Branchiostoma lanceolatum]|uniref:Hypp7538 protein n=1 Tax=Branchiostoma lanceolatum TaxID=7740 RepID=A0A8J9Z274_BRALA|nr:Hypp7538 [Branchiostoma lanceolatum]